MNIYFTGAQGTGKTTLAKMISEQYGLELVSSITRSLVESGKMSPEETSQGATPKTQRLIFDEYYNIFNKKKAVVSDRFLTDVLAYTRYVYRRDEDPDMLDEMHREREYLDQLAFCQGLMYGDTQDAVVFYLPIEFSPEDDGVRDTDPIYQSQIDELIRKELSYQGIRYYKLTGSVEERIETIKATLISIFG